MYKKLLVVAVVGVAAYIAYNRFSSAKAERDLWTEATTAPETPEVV